MIDNNIAQKQARAYNRSLSTATKRHCFATRLSPRRRKEEYMNQHKNENKNCVMSLFYERNRKGRAGF